MTAPSSPRGTISLSGISHVLLDIEGTTCPVSFVAGTLFPYAARHLEAYLIRHSQEPEVQRLRQEVEQAWRSDGDPRARELLAAASAPGEQKEEDLAMYLRWLISIDRKLTPLKELQGLIWEAGYASGELVAPLFEDVAPTLRRWHGAGLVLAVYSSGSVVAQHLLYGHSNAGDLRPLFAHWFDTRQGPKREPSSYTGIAQAMEAAPQQVLFLSDALAECQAAAAAGLQVLFSLRPGNPEPDSGAFTAMSRLDQLSLNA